MGRIQDRFIYNTLRDAGERMLARQKTAILTEVTERTGNLRLGRTMKVIPGTDGGTLEFEHRIYERFLDMKRRGSTGAKRSVRKIHNRFVYGMYGKVSYRLLHGLTDEVQAAISDELRQVAQVGTITIK